MVTSAQSTEKDPMVLGVSVPLGVTLTAAKEVGTAWREFGINLFQAIKHQKDAMAKTKGSGAASKSNDDLDGSASSSAGVSA